MPLDYIRDDFNLTGLQNIVPHFLQALDVIQDYEPSTDSESSCDERSLQSSAVLLYYLIHQRFILSKQGLPMMAEKYKHGDFGVCPRYFCAGSRVLPIGLSDLPGKQSVCLFCPNCVDVYHPADPIYRKIDGVGFGRTFCHLLLKVMPEIFIQPSMRTIYEPRIFGFKIHSSSSNAPSMHSIREEQDFYSVNNQ